MKTKSILLGLVLLPSLCLGQFIFRGKIIDASNQKPIYHANIELNQNNKLSRIETDSSGEFSVESKYQFVNLKVWALGFETKLVQPNANDYFIVSLKPISFQAQEAIVQAVKAGKKDPITYSEITQKEIEKLNLAQDLPYLLNMQPSTVVSSDAGAGVGYTGIRIRGSDPARTNVTINGVPVNDAESHGVFWVNMPDLASSTQSIQIQRGVGTSTAGAAAFGATIALQTEGFNLNPLVEYSTSAGSFNTFKNTLKLSSGLLNNAWVFDVRLSKISSDGYIDRATSDLGAYYLSGSYQNKKHQVKAVVFSGAEKTYQAWNGVSETELKAGNRTHNDFTYQNQTDNYKQDNYQLFYTYTLNTHLKTNIGAHYTYGRGYYEEYREDDLFATYKLTDTVIVNNDTLTSGNFVRRRWLKNHFYGMVASAIYEKDKVTIIVGGAANQYKGNHYGELIWAEYALGSNIHDHFYDGNSVKTDINYYGKLNYQFTSKLAGFFDWQQRFISYRLNGEDLNGSNYLPYHLNLNYNFINPKIGLSLQTSINTQLYAFYGIVNKEPVRNDLIQANQNNLPKPEQLQNFELGLKNNFKRVYTSLNFYYMKYKNQLVLTGQINDVGAYNRSNVAQSYRMGLEFLAAIKLLKNLNWQATFTVSQNKINSFTAFIDDWDNGGQQTINYQNTDISFSPQYIASSVFTYQLLKQFEIDLFTKYVSRQYLDNTQNKTRSLNAFVVNDIKLNYTITPSHTFKEVSVGLLINNVLNALYESNGYTYSGISGNERLDFNYYYPQAGTNFMAQLNVKF